MRDMFVTNFSMNGRKFIEYLGYVRGLRNTIAAQVAWTPIIFIRNLDARFLFATGSIDSSFDRK